MRTYAADDGTLDVLNITGDDAIELLRLLDPTKRSAAPGLPSFLVELRELALRHQPRPLAVFDEPQEVSTSAAADAIGVDARHVRKLCKAKKLRARKLDSGDWLIDVGSLADHIARRLERDA